MQPSCLLTITESCVLSSFFSVSSADVKRTEMKLIQLICWLLNHIEHFS